MIRYLAGLVLALALSVMGCSEASGTGGSAGDGGDGGHGGGPVESCEGVDDLVGCEGPGFGLCSNEICMIGDCAEAQDWAYCLAPEAKFFSVGLCQAGTCVRECSVLEEGDGCLLLGTGLDDFGFCQEGFCRSRCVSDADCDDSDDCTLDRCLVDGACKHFPQPDGTSCSHPPAGVTGTCDNGICGPLVQAAP